MVPTAVFGIHLISNKPPTYKSTSHTDLTSTVVFCLFVEELFCCILLSKKRLATLRLLVKRLQLARDLTVEDPAQIAPLWNRWIQTLVDVVYEWLEAVVATPVDVHGE